MVRLREEQRRPVQDLSEHLEAQLEQWAPWLPPVEVDRLLRPLEGPLPELAREELQRHDKSF